MLPIPPGGRLQTRRKEEGRAWDSGEAQARPSGKSPWSVKAEERLAIHSGGHKRQGQRLEHLEALQFLSTEDTWSIQFSTSGKPTCRGAPRSELTNVQPGLTLTAPVATVIVVVWNLLFPKKYQNGDRSEKSEMCLPRLHSRLGSVFILYYMRGERPLASQRGGFPGVSVWLCNHPFQKKVAFLTN